MSRRRTVQVQLKKGKEKKEQWKTKKSQESRTLTYLMCSIKCSGEKTMDTRIRSRRYLTRERQAKMAGTEKELAFRCASLAAAPYSSNTAVYCREDRAHNPRDNHFNSGL